MTRNDGDDDLLGGDRRAPFDMMDGAQLVLAGAKRRILQQDHPFAARIGRAAGDFLAAIEQHDPRIGSGAARDHGPPIGPDARNVEARRHDRRRRRGRPGNHRAG